LRRESCPARLAKDFGRATAKAINCPSLELLSLSSNRKTLVEQSIKQAIDLSMSQGFMSGTGEKLRLKREAGNHLDAQPPPCLQSLSRSRHKHAPSNHRKSEIILIAFLVPENPEWCEERGEVFRLGKLEGELLNLRRSGAAKSLKFSGSAPEFSDVPPLNSPTTILPHL
jgi:hypothetical protein